MSKLSEDFRKFVMRGNVLDLAVAVVIGVAFNAVVTSLVNDVIMQVIAAIFGKANFDKLTWTLNGGVIYYGRFLTALVNFLIVAATLFVVIKAFEEMQKRRKGTSARIRRGREERRSRPPHARSATCWASGEPESTYRSNAGLRHCTTSAGGTSNILW